MSLSSTDLPALGARYEAKARLGEGAMGEVFLALDRESGEEVALKVLRQARGPGDYLAFQQEFRAMARVRHPHVCAVHDYGQLPDGRPFFTMELVPGEDLSKRLPMPWAQASQVLAQLGQALGAIHEAGYVHGDLKPDNLRLRPDGQLKLMDFGLFSRVGQSHEAIRGSLSYLAPEAFRLDPLDGRADLYALGVLTHELLSGALPFQGEGPLDLAKAHLHEAPTPLGELVPGLPVAVERAVLALLAKEAQDRPATAAEALHALGIPAGAAGPLGLLAPAWVGRGQELLAWRTEFAQQLAKGQGLVRALVGPEGVGKSRLLQELRTAEALDGRTVWGGVAPEAPRPFGPWLTPLRAAWGPFAEAQPERAAALQGVAATLLPELGAAEEGEAEQLKGRLVRLVAEVLGTVAQGLGGAFVVLDAWERADWPSQEVLGELQRGLEAWPLILVLGSRGPAPEGAAQLQLGPLKAEDAVALAASMLGLEALPPSLGAQLTALCEGLPGALVALLRHLVDSGALPQEAGRWRLPELIPPELLPSDRKAMALARVQALPPVAQHLAAWASLLEAPFDLALAQQALDWLDVDLLDATEALLGAGLLQASGGRYAWAEPWVRATVASTVAPEQAQAWHGAIARALPSPEPGADYAELARFVRHQLAGDRPAEGLEAAWWLTKRQCLLFLLPEALQTAELALAVAGPLGEAVPMAVRFGLRQELVMVAYRQMDLSKARALLAHLAPLAEAWAAQGEVRGRAEHGYLLACVAMQEAKVASYRELDAVLPQVIEWAQALGDRQREALARVHWGRSAFFQGRHSEAIVRLQAAADLADAEAMPGPSGRAKAVLGHLLALKEGEARLRGLRLLEEAGAQLREVEDVMGQMVHENLRFETMLALGRLGEALEAATAHEALGRRHGAVDDALVGGLNLAVALQELGRPAPTLAQAQRILQEAKAHRHEVVAAFALALVAWGQALTGHLAEAAAALQEAEEALRQLSSYVFLGAFPQVVATHLALGQLTMAMHQAQEAQFQLRGAEDPAAELRLALTLVQCYLALGNAEQAEGFAQEAVAKAKALDARAQLLRAHLLLAQVQLEQGQLKEVGHDLQLASQLLAEVDEALAGQQLAALQARLAKEDGDLAYAAKAWQEAAERAGQNGTPIAQALARAGRGMLPGSGEVGANLLSEAQKTLKAAVRGLSAEQAGAFHRLAEVQEVLERIPGLDAEEEEEAAALTLGRLERIGVDLQAVSQHYGRLLHDGRRRGDQLEALNELATALNESLDLERVLPLVVMRTLELTTAERGFVFLTDPHEHDGLRLAIALDRHGRAIPHEQASRSACRKVLGRGEPLVVMDAASDEEFQASRSVMALHLRTLMAVPLRVQERPLGVLYVDSQAVVSTFTERDVRLLTAIAAHAAVAIENARLLSALSARAAELEQALELYRQAQHEASTDALTGLRNRRAFEACAAAEIARSRRHGHPLSLIMLDVDHFKKFNDTYGHALGDEVLKAVGRVLPEVLRVPDVPARLGGEEFAILCPDTGPEGALLVAKRLGDALRAVHLHDAEGQRVRPITATLGVSSFLPEDSKLEAMLARADAALYAGKAAGRDRSVLWQPGLGQGA